MKKKKQKKKTKIKSVQNYTPKYKKNGKRKEKWKPIKGWKHLYEISDLGRVRSLEHTVEVHSKIKGSHSRTYRERILKLDIDRRGYRHVSLYRSCKSKSHSVHRLVFRAFHGKITAPQIMHLDGDPSNNRAENLRQGSAMCNQAFRIDHGTNGHKLTEKDVIEIRALVVAGELTQIEIAVIYGIKRANVSKIALRKIWKHI